MLFNSAEYLIFLPIVILLYFVLPVKAKNPWLLIASYYFYMCWNAKYALLMLLSTFITFMSGIYMEKIKEAAYEPAKEVKLKNIVVAISFISNLGILFFFKYFNFAAELVTDFFALLNIQMHTPSFDVLLPVGISFYTFQALSYTMDIYRNELKAEKNFFQYALFVSFFPQLVAGPIERSKNLIKQLSVVHKFDWDNFREGILLILWGFFLKIVIADRLAIFVDAVYNAPGYYSGGFLIVASFLFILQVYCDFYGYSTIAMGSAKILGIQLMENFQSPYLSTSVAEFWRRWHVSLSSWFKDYLYIPLGGSRKGKLRKYINLMIVFTASGLWHGAALTYVVWGALNGLYQVIGEVTKPLRDKLVRLLRLNRESLGHRIVCTIITFSLFAFSMIFFRARNIRHALQVIKGIIYVRNPWIFFDGSLFLSPLDYKLVLPMTIFLGILLFADICKARGIAIRKIIMQQDYWFRWLFIAVSVAVILVFGIWGPGFSEANFIYFQF